MKPHSSSTGSGPEVNSNRLNAANVKALLTYSGINRQAEKEERQKHSIRFDFTIIKHSVCILNQQPSSKILNGCQVQTYLDVFI